MENDYNLNLSLYLNTTEAVEDVDYLEAYDRMQSIKDERNIAEQRVVRHHEVIVDE